MRQLTRRWSLFALALCLLSGALAASAQASRIPTGAGHVVFHPRVGHAMGLVPRVNSKGAHTAQLPPAAIYAPLTYHGGRTMTGGVTVHTLFWGPSGHDFEGAPPGSKSYQALIEQYLTDVAAASTGAAGQTCTSAACNIFTATPQYGWGTSTSGVQPGANSITYNAALDAVVDTNPYPASGCSSPSGFRTCLTDQQVQSELDRVVQATAGQPRGLHNVWDVFLPPEVDECAGAGDCGSNAFGGYHSLSNVHGHGVTIYALIVDPIIEIGGFPQGQDPNGNPDAEVAIDVAAHEVTEAITDPLGNGWMDPNGFEVGDKCDLAPNRGTPLGYASNGSPYNQVVNAHKYLIQEAWSNDDGGCVQATTNETDPLPLPQVDLTQFSSIVRGNTENNTAGIHVTVKLIRSDAGRHVTVATGSATTAANGSWTVRLSGHRAVGDDRDQIEVDYSGTQAPRDDVILSGNGGDPFTLTGWTSWIALDAGSALTNHDKQLGGPSLTLGPCFQIGVLAYSGASGPPAEDYCSNAATNTAEVPLAKPVSRGARVTVTSMDNRGFAPRNLPRGGNLIGALVRMTVPVGEPDAAPNFRSALPGFKPTGLPLCATDLGVQAVACNGLVPGGRYTLTDRGRKLSGTADTSGTVFKRMQVRRGDSIRLSNSATTLTTLHVARLQVHLLGNRGLIIGGACSPGQYWGGPLTRFPISRFPGEPTRLFGGSALTGQICPAGGSPAGLPTKDIAQTDERSGGETLTQVAQVLDTSPIYGENVYGQFTAVAEASDGRSPISLVIERIGKHRPAFRARNVATPRGVAVRGLKAGRYVASWTVHNLNGDTRTVLTRFIVQRSPSGRSRRHH